MAKVYRKSDGQSFERETQEAAEAVVAAEPDLYTLEAPEERAAFVRNKSTKDSDI